MKQQISPKAAISIIVVIVVIVGILGYRVWSAPSSVPVTNTTAGGESLANPRLGGGPTEEDLRRRDEYNRTHPNAQGSR